MSNNGQAPLAVLHAKNGLFNDLVSDDIVIKLIPDYMKKHGLTKPVHVETPTGVLYRDGGCSVFCKNGVIEVDLGAFRFKDAAVWQKEIGALLSRVAGLLFQQQVQRVVANHGEVLQEQKAGNGAVVLSVRLSDGAGVITMAIFPNGRIAFFGDAESVPGGKESLKTILIGLASNGLVGIPG